MASTNLRAFQHCLQHGIHLEDDSWSFRVPNLPSPATTNSQQLIKAIALVSNSEKQQMILRLQTASINRAISADPLDRFIIISFAGFRLRVPQSQDKSGPESQPATARESADYIVKLLQWGVVLNGVHYNFYGHSNSQLQSRTCFLYAAPKLDISRKVENLGDFTKMKTVAKKSKRIGLLFSVAKIAMDVDPKRCADIPDIETNDYVFTDGCGLIAPRLARELSRTVRITFRNTRYTPSVFQIRYQGYKGVLMVDPSMEGETQIKFRKSMKKFTGGSDNSFSVVDHSKPYGFGYLNDEVVLLLHALGIYDTVLIRKQSEHFQFLASAVSDPRQAFRFLSYMNNIELAERVLMDSIESVRPTITRLVNTEYERMLNKRDEQRCRILIPKSRLLFGICDPWGVLKEGECAVKVTMDGDGMPRSLHGMEILVTRNPCLHPGDLQKFKVVAKDELAHLVDCIVFSTRGKRPAADLMSGGDLDGDTFFVCWDSDLIPGKLSEPAHYPGAKEPVMFKAITDDDRLEYFARYTNASLGRVKNLYLDWARLKGPMSPECQQLNRLFSMCVDGNRIKVPPKLESPPPPSPDSPPFILDTLHNEAKGLIRIPQNSGHNFDGYNFDAMELLLSRDDVAISEFELMKLTFRWCRRNQAALMDFLHLFDVNLLTSEEKMWTLNQLPPSAETSSSILNALSRSNLLHNSELAPFKLNYPGLRWKCIYDSSQDRLAVFLDKISRALELFHKKLIVVRVDERLTLAIYIPQKIQKQKECQIDDRVRLFAFPHSQGNETSHRLALPTKVNYRLYCDNNVFQLFESQRSNSWVYIVKGPSNDSSYRGQDTAGGRRRGRQFTVDSGLNFDCRASIALDKFSRGLQKHIGRVNRNGVLGAEIYVISNRDVKSMQNLDLWLEFIDTEEIMPLFERNAREYSIAKLCDVEWSDTPDHLVQIARQRNFIVFNSFKSEKQYREVFEWLSEKAEGGLLLQCFEHLLAQLGKQENKDWQVTTIKAMLDFLKHAPLLSVSFARMDPWANLTSDASGLLERSAPTILQAHILSANEMEEFVVGPFKTVISRVQSMTLTDFSELVELISLTVRSSDVALDLFLECLEPESSRILPGSPALIQHFVRNLLGIALDHIDEAAEKKLPRKDLLELKLTHNYSQGYPLVDCHLRIDAPIGTLATLDHVRLTTASSLINSVTSLVYSIDAIVDSFQPGLATFRCFHALPPFVEDCSWELENCGSFVTTKAMFDAVGKLATEQDCCLISGNILGELNVPASNPLPTGYIPNERLNASQRAAVETSLASALTCLWGPPGTGKTYTIVEIIKQLLKSRSSERILVTAPTHNAVDNVMRKYLANTTSENPSNSAAPLALRVSTDVRKVAEDLKKFTCDAMAGKELYSSYSAMNKARDQIKKCRLIFTTCIGAGLGLLRSEMFETVIIDEASQQTEAASLVPLVKGCRSAILVGDHVQLGATVQRHAVLQQFDVSLFERLYRNQEPQTIGFEDDSTVAYKFVSRVMLDTQYRMHSSICKFSSDEFYGSRLLTGISDNARPLGLSSFPWPLTTETSSGGPIDQSNHQARMIFIECSAPEDLGCKSKSNEGQATLCHEVCKMLSSRPVYPSGNSSSSASLTAQTPEQQSIAVLTPYSRQAELLRSRLSQFPNAEVCSIDGFQGREADIVIFVTVRCNAHHDIGFLKDLRRMNVALTRARAAVIVIGNRLTLTIGTADPESTLVWKRLLSTLVEVKLD